MKAYYEQSGIIIYHGDCLETLPNVSDFDTVITDPPYASGARRDADKTTRGAMTRMADNADWFSHDQMTGWGYSWFLRGLLVHIAAKLSSGGHLYCFSDWRQTPNIYAILESVGLRVNQCLVWDKIAFGLGAYWRNQHENIVFASQGQPSPMTNKGLGSVLHFNGVHASQRDHPTEKPLHLLTHIISGIPGDCILDPFMGSGTTLRAAKNLGRKAIGIEIDERYCEIAANQLSQEVLAL